MDFRALGLRRVAAALGGLFIKNEATGTGWERVLTTSDSISSSVEGTAVLSTGETGGNKYLREDGDGTCSWQAGGAGANQLTDLSDVNTAGVTNRYVLVADGVDYESRALLEADISDLGAYITGYTVTEGDVTAHQAALSITESQISDLGTYLTSLTPWTENVAGGGFNLSGVGDITATGTGTFGTYNYFQDQAVSGVITNPPTAGDEITNSIVLNDRNGVWAADFSFYGDSTLVIGSWVIGGNVNIFGTYGYSDPTWLSDVVMDYDGANRTLLMGNWLELDCSTVLTGTEDNYVLTYDHASGQAQFEAAAGGGASQLSDLSDVNTSTATDKNVLVADGVDFESRPLVEADISDLGTYLTAAADETVTGQWTFPEIISGDHIRPVNNSAFLTGTGYHVLNTGLVISGADSGNIMVRGRYFANNNTVDNARQGSFNVSLRLLTGGEPDNPQVEFTGDYFEYGISSKVARVARRDSDGTLAIFFRDAADLSANMTYIIDDIWNNTSGAAYFDSTMIDLATLTATTGYSDVDAAMNVEDRDLYAGSQIGLNTFNGDSAVFGISNTNGGGTTNSVSFHMQATDGFDGVGSTMDQGVVLTAAMNATNATQDLIISLPANDQGDTPTERYRFSDDKFSTLLDVEAGNLNVTDWDTAFGWGDHAGLYSLLAHTHELDELDATAITDGYVLTADGAGNAVWEAASGGGATQLSDLTDVNTSTVTNRNVLVADGVDFESRALVEADISDLGTYLLDTTDTFTGLLTVNGGVAVTASGTGVLSLTHTGTADLTLAKSGSGDTVISHSGAGTILIDGIDFPVQAPLWNTAYGWGDHSVAGYLTAIEGTAVDATAVTDGHVLTADGAGNSVWEAPAAGSETNDLTAAVTWANIPIANVPTGTTGSTVALGNHTHVAADVTDFDTEVANNTAVAANTAKVTNATHTGDVTGDTVLTIAAGAVDLAMLANGTDGELITWDAAGAPAAVAVGTATHVLTSNGAGAAPTFQAAAGGSSFNKNIGMFTRTSSQNITTSSATISWNTEDADPDGNWANSSGVLTSTDAGWYHIDVNVPMNDDGATGGTRTRANLWIEQDGGTGTWVEAGVRTATYVRESAGGGTGISVGGMFELSAGEAIRARIRQNVNTDTSTVADETTLNLFRVSE